MPASLMQRNQRTLFTCLRSEGALLPLDFLQRVVNRDPVIAGLTAEAYHHDGEQLYEVINRSWSHLLNAWRSFDAARIRLMEGDSDTLLTRERWLLPLFSELGYGRLQPSKPLELDGKRYPVSHVWNMLPIHLVG